MCNCQCLYIYPANHFAGNYLHTCNYIPAGAPDLKCPVQSFDVQFLYRQSCIQSAAPPVNLEFLEVAAEYMTDNNIALPSSIREAIMLLLCLFGTLVREPLIHHIVILYFLIV